jgi:hypothetical protein
MHLGVAGIEQQCRSVLVHGRAEIALAREQVPVANGSTKANVRQEKLCPLASANTQLEFPINPPTTTTADVITG